MFIELIPPLTSRDIILNTEMITSIEKTHSQYEDADTETTINKFNIIIYMKESLFNIIPHMKVLNNNNIPLTFTNEDDRDEFYKKIRHALETKMLQGQEEEV